MGRVKSKIELYRGVPISTDFKHAPLFGDAELQKKWFDKFKIDRLTFEGSYQRVEEQIKTKFKYEELVDINYLHVINPSAEGVNKANAEWWGFVMDVHYINDGLCTIDWVVDPIQTFMHKWDLSYAFIERGMMDLVVEDKKDSNKVKLNNSKASLLSNSEPIGVDGLAYQTAIDNVLEEPGEDGRTAYCVIVRKNAKGRSFVGTPSQLEYLVIPYNKKNGVVEKFTIHDVPKNGGGKTTVTNNKNITLNELLVNLGQDAEFSKGGGNVISTYFTNEVGLVFKLNPNSGHLETTLNPGEFNIIGSDSMELLQTGGGNGDKPDPKPPSGGEGNPGEWDGKYPPSITSNVDKFAWQLYSMLISAGYSKAAAAGILGNAQQETGGSMNPDIDQIGGPAYGVVQWDGSAYPLVGSPTNNGREYVQRLMKAAGITEDYKTMKAQVKLINWCMTNGQWIGKVNPTTVAGFKTVGDAKTAAYAFEMNFERPAIAHPERQGHAVTWFNKFKDLK